MPNAGGGLGGNPDIRKKLHPSGMMRDYSAFSIISKETAETKFESNASNSSLTLAPQFKFGMQKGKGSPRLSPKKGDGPSKK